VGFSTSKASFGWQAKILVQILTFRVTENDLILIGIVFTFTVEVMDGESIHAPMSAQHSYRLLRDRFDHRFSFQGLIDSMPFAITHKAVVVEIGALRGKYISSL
jgi:hypothetical protein